MRATRLLLLLVTIRFASSPSEACDAGSYHRISPGSRCGATRFVVFEALDWPTGRCQSCNSPTSRRRAALYDPLNRGRLLRCRESRLRAPPQKTLVAPEIRVSAVDRVSRVVSASSPAFKSQMTDLRGGGMATRKLDFDHRPPSTGGRRASTPILVAISISLLATLVYAEHGETVAEFVSSVFDVERFKSWLLRTLNDLNERGGKRGLVLYSVLLALWECVGLSTLALETSAGMAFGIRKGLPANMLGKIGGCLLAYSLGRVFLEEAVRERLGKNHDLLNLMERSVERKPFRTALMMRASVFPTLIKNFGLSVMPAISPRVYAASTALYLIPFSVLWTAAGADSAARLRADTAGEVIPANRVLGGCLLLATVFMVVGSPAVLAIWIRDMRQDQLEMRNNEVNQGIKAKHAMANVVWPWERQ